MTRIYANENFPLPVVQQLRRLGHDLLTTVERGQAGRAIADADVLAFAITEQRALITLNRLHFLRLHRTTPDHFGSVVCTFDLDFLALAQRIHTALTAQASLAGQVVRVNRAA